MFHIQQAALGVLLAASALRGRPRHAIVAWVAGMATVWLAYFGMIRPVEDSFGSGHIYAQPDFDKAAWEAKFERYRIGEFEYLRRLLDVDRGIKEYHEGRV